MQVVTASHTHKRGELSRANKIPEATTINSDDADATATIVDTTIRGGRIYELATPRAAV